MRILVVHDKRGNISSFGVPNRKLKTQPELQPPRGKLVTAVEVPEIKDIAGSKEEEHERVYSILKQARIDISGEKARLVQK